jgi:hypothetical protein
MTAAVTRTRWSAVTATSVVLLAVFITWLLAGFQAVANVGGYCASGGPYAITTPCPENSTALILIGMFGSAFVALAGTVAALSVGAPNLVVPYWTFTLGGMSVQALVDGFTSDGGWVWGWIVGGALGLLLALPGAYLMTPWQRVYDREPLEDAPLSRGAWWLVYLGLGAVGVALGLWTAANWL